jgi:hypothetical protein
MSGPRSSDLYEQSSASVDLGAPVGECPACGSTDCECVLFTPDCLTCMRPADECICTHAMGVELEVVP